VEITPAKRVGTILRLLREETGQSQREVGESINLSDTTISHLENGSKGAHVETVNKLGKAIRHEKVVAELWGFVGSPDVAAASDLLRDYEREANRISVWTTMYVHALLQTPDYARVITEASLPFAPDDEVADLTTKRLARQSALARQKPPTMWAVLNESVLYSTYGASPKVMRAQLDHLITQASRPGTVIQVMPFDAGRHPGLEGPLGIIEFIDKTPVWYSDGWAAGKLSDDRGEVADYAQYFDIIRAEALSPAKSLDLINQIGRERYEQ
jgi:transcriptional regulator with XRE-family HTH domain